MSWHYLQGLEEELSEDNLLGWKCVCAVEIEDYPRKVLLARQRDGILPRFPIWDDITTFDGNPWRGRVDVVSGGFPCQDISAAGKGAGIDGSRSGLWAEFARVIGEVQPPFVLVENSPMLTLRGLDRVLGDLATLGYDAKWGVFSAADVGARHERERIWVVAHTKGSFGPERVARGVLLQNDEQKREGRDTQIWGEDRLLFEVGQKGNSLSHNHKPPTPESMRVADDVADELDRLKAIGNGQVPAVVRLAWDTLTKGEIVK